MYDIRVTPVPAYKDKPQDESKLGFGRRFTDYMFVMEYNRKDGWCNARVQPYEKFQMDPACMVLHYGQSVFAARTVGCSCSVPGITLPA